MPLSIKVPPAPLEELCLTYTGKMILNFCKMHPNGHSKEIQDMSNMIPVTLANEYMAGILFMSAHVTHFKDVNIRDSVCRWCTRIAVATVGEEISLLENLNRLKNLTHLWMAWSDSSKPNPTIAILVARNLPRLRKLKSLRLASVVTDEVGLFNKLVKYCPDLQELCMKWGLSRNQKVTLAKCRNLKRVYVEYCGGRVDDVKYILDSVPHLEVLLIQKYLIRSLLRSLRKSYPSLKQLKICDCNNVTGGGAIEGSTLLTCLVRHFPKLEFGIFGHCKDLTPLNRFGEMKILHLTDCNPEHMMVVNRIVYSRLIGLSLSRVLKLSPTLKAVKDLSMSNLTELKLYKCDHVDFQQLQIICPQLQELYLYQCGVYPINNDDMTQPFTTLQKLFIYDSWSNLNWDHLMFLTSKCSDMKILEIWQDTLSNETVHNLLEVNPMPRMLGFDFISNSLTPDIVTVMFNYFGNDLVFASFKGALMENVSKGFLQDMWKKIQPYCIYLTIGSIDMKTKQTCHWAVTYDCPEIDHFLPIPLLH